MTADEVIAHLDLKPHPEGGHFRETFRDESGTNQRGASTAIYYLLRAGETSHWHRVDAAEVWHWYAGDALELSLFEDGRTITRHLLGPSLTKRERPQ
ncbi:MAG: cupin domain-containing protein, partial [Micropepsaceae bacterium]